MTGSKKKKVAIVAAVVTGAIAVGAWAYVVGTGIAAVADKG